MQTAEAATVNSESRARVRVVDLWIDLCNYESVIEKATVLARARHGGYICVANVHMTVEAHGDLDFANLVNAADFVVPDGMPIVWMLKKLGNKDATQVRGPSLMPMLMRHAEANDLKVGFIGGKPEVIDEIKKRATTEFPLLDIGYAYSPPFRRATADEDSAIVEEVNASGPQILFVGLGCPKQERWMAEHCDRVNAVLIGVGAAFDLYAGVLPEAPDWMRKSGLEWLFRLTREPRRLWRRYLVTNSKFVVLTAEQLFRSQESK